MQHPAMFQWDGRTIPESQSWTRSAEMQGCWQRMMAMETNDVSNQVQIGRKLVMIMKADK
uniref:Uncharacterized protein n=1 Tax=Romanomermis culicivorax TaxID=13658 RepID=A0A915I053_ROMCU